jgi:predicted dehydrogenase
LEVPREFWKWPGSPRDPLQGDPLVSFRYDQVWDFVDAIRQQRPCAVTFHDGARVQEVMDAIVRSVESRAWVELNSSS